MKTNAKVLKQHHRKLRELAEEGVQEGHIGEEDGQNMLPKEPKAARFYMNCKDHKPIVP